MREKNYVTWAFLAIQLLVFLLMEIQGGSTSSLVLLQFGARSNLLIDMGQYWRLITPIFIHIGFSHLLVNSLTLYYLGSLAEGVLGHWRFALFYLLAGLMGNALSYQFNPGAISAGASTSLFGLFALFIALKRIFPNHSGFQYLGSQYQALLLVNLLMNIFMGGVDIWGHLGGALGGFLASYYMLGRTDALSKWQRLISFVLYWAILVIILVIN
ncbi:rhomboid family intramembrane serine protease [Aerococcus urinaehominis]|uniref:Rhomboid family intramembrane serine protease n=1 Tax=Aerococcus urinaehominis TaxID=128944 RepID=A0A109RGI1_9LACT|nr:rhomboid family intramembrane serine protease [Aerococcus urinaehominis]AMB98918.1 rhomboid family intramembrane serine protease [Aerococcus urinaehominis]SDM39529.1 rhomboid protease GluP [Aerococcus urinaehominis]